MKNYFLTTLFVLNSLCYVQQSTSSTHVLDDNLFTLNNKKRPWQQVFIAADHCVYIYDKRAIQLWNFAGTNHITTYNTQYIPDEITIIEHEVPDFYYQKYLKKITVTSMTHEYTNNIIMKASIIQSSFSKTGFALLTEDNFITLFDSHGNPQEKPFAVKAKQHLRITLLDNGELFIMHPSGKLIRQDSKGNKKVMRLKQVPKKMFSQKTSLGHLVVATEHHTIAYSAALNIIDFDNNTLVTSISLPQLPNAWDLNNNLLAVAYGDTDSDITIQVFDITTGRECYYHLLQENYGTYTLRLDHEKIYFVSDLPKPCSLIIDISSKG